MLKRMNIGNPTQQQKEEAEKKAIEEHHAILFMLGADNYKYKLIKEMKNDILSKKDPFPKTVAEAFNVLSKWKNHFGGRYNNNKSESNNGMDFTMVTEERKKQNR